MDLMFKVLCNAVDDQTALGQLVAFVVEEEFDSESIDTDIDMFKTTKTCNLPMIDPVISFIRDHRLSTHTFSTGIEFWYWKWYGTIDDAQLAEDVTYANMNFSGYSVKQTFVWPPHFASLKAEVLATGLISISEFREHVIEKGDAYIDTAHCKRMRSVSSFYGSVVKDALHNELNVGSLLWVEHL